MGDLPVPSIQVVETTSSYGKFILEPLERGFGITLGNALRRILLSSLPGYAVTAVHIEGVQHELSTIPFMKEDVMDFLLNVKGIRLQPVVVTDRAFVMRLEWQGEGKVHAGDLEQAAECQVVNRDMVLATMDDPSARLSVEFHVQRGTGYQPAGGRDERESIGMLPLDAIFTPTRKVNFEVEQTRIGQVTDFERLVLEVWTDETIGPDDAVRQAAQLLVDHFSYFAFLGRPTAAVPERRTLVTPVSDEIYHASIEDLKLPSRTLNCLRRGSISTIGEVLERTPQELLALRNFGERSLEELYGRLQAMGIPVDLEEARGRRHGANAKAAEDQLESGESPEAEQEDTVLRAYSAGADEEELEEAPPTVGRTFYPD